MKMKIWDSRVVYLVFTSTQCVDTVKKRLLEPVGTLQKVHVKFRSKVRSLPNLDTIFRSNLGCLDEKISVKNHQV